MRILDIINRIQVIGNKLSFKSRELKSIEELSELIRAITRHDYENLIEETADSIITVMQLLNKYSVELEEVLSNIEYKLSLMEELLNE